MEDALRWLSKEGWPDLSDLIAPQLGDGRRGRVQLTNRYVKPHKPPQTVAKRLCTRCRASLPLFLFTPDRSRPDGIKNWCRPCCATYNRTRT